MANVQRSYVPVGPSTDDLLRLSTGDPAVLSQEISGKIVVQVDSASVSALDEAMNSLGFALETLPAISPMWSKYTVTFSELAAASLNNDIELFSLPAKCAIHDVVIKQSTSFSGGLIATYTLSVGIATNPIKYAAAFNVLQAPGNAVFQLATNQGVESFGTATSIRVAAVSTDDPLNAATQGSADIWVLISRLP